MWIFLLLLLLLTFFSPLFFNNECKSNEKTWSKREPNSYWVRILFISSFFLLCSSRFTLHASHSRRTGSQKRKRKEKKNHKMLNSSRIKTIYGMLFMIPVVLIRYFTSKRAHVNKFYYFAVVHTPENRRSGEVIIFHPVWSVIDGHAIKINGMSTGKKRI